MLLLVLVLVGCWWYCSVVGGVASVVVGSGGVIVGGCGG